MVRRVQTSGEVKMSKAKRQPPIAAVRMLGIQKQDRRGLSRFDAGTLMV